VLRTQQRRSRPTAPSENCAGGWVSLIPQDPGLRSPPFIRYARCQANGRFEIADVRPGEYYATAYRFDPAFPFWMPGPGADENQALTVTIHPGESVTADLRAIAPPLY
jgi:hypothetical protein